MQPERLCSIYYMLIIHPNGSFVNSAGGFLLIIKQMPPLTLQIKPRIICFCNTNVSSGFSME